MSAADTPRGILRTEADDAADREAAERAARRLAGWMREARMVAHSYGVNGLCLVLFALAGTVHWSAALVYAVPGVLACLVTAMLLRQGCSLWNDPSLSLLRAVTGMAVCGVGLALYPEVAFFYVLVLFNIFVSATYRMPRDKTLLAWAVVSAVIAAATLGGGRSLQIPHANLAEQALAGLCFVVTLSRCVLLSVVNTRNNLLLRDRGQQMAAALAEIERLANDDELTGLPNRRSMLRMLDDEIARAARSEAPLCIALIDIDHFKRINDRHGHGVGDEALRRFADVVRTHLRATDRFGRHGGEEFLLLMPDTPLADAQRAVERLRAAVCESDWNTVAPGLCLRFSAGLADYRAGGPVDELLSRADRGLYDAKEAGRDCHRNG